MTPATLRVRIATPAVTYRLRLGDEDDDWRDADACLEQIDQVIAWYASQARLTCCTIGGGFFIHADAELWNESAVDEVRMSESWPAAVTALLEGQCVQRVWAWEESGMTIVREGDIVELYDVHHSGSVVCPPVRFDLRAFARALLGATEVFAELVFALRERISSSTGPTDEQKETLLDNFGAHWPELARDLRAALERATTGIPPSPEGAAEPPPGLFRAIVLDDRARADRALEEDAAARDRMHDAESPLHVAVRYRRLDLVRLLVQRGADVNAYGRYAINCANETPLHYACQRGLLDVATLLLEHGAAASLAVQNQLGVTPLEWAAQAAFERPSELCDLLLRSGAELTLRAAMQMGRRADVERLVTEAPRHPDLFVHWFRGLRARGYDPSADYERTVKDGVRRWMPTLTRLVTAGAPIDGTGPLAYTPALHEAVNAADPILVEALLDLGADPLTKDSNGTTALDKAHGPVRALLERRAGPRTPGK